MKNISIRIDDQISSVLPQIRLGCLLAEVEVLSSTVELRRYIAGQLEKKQEKLDLGEIHSIRPLKHSRDAYKSLGKDPSRYRPSAEALLRRVVQGKGLYRINNVVDVLNLVSVNTGFSIGGYDAAKINGPVLLGKGVAGEPYEAIGRGQLNIADLPVLRDASGAFGSPTSDSARTMVTGDTMQFLAVLFAFNEQEGALIKAMDMLASLLERFAKGNLLEFSVVNSAK